MQDFLTKESGRSGVRFGVKRTGCSGFAYTVDMAQTVDRQRPRVRRGWRTRRGRPKEPAASSTVPRSTSSARASTRRSCSAIRTRPANAAAARVSRSRTRPTRRRAVSDAPNRPIRSDSSRLAAWSSHQSRRVRNVAAYPGHAAARPALAFADVSLVVIAEIFNDFSFYERFDVRSDASQIGEFLVAGIQPADDDGSRASTFRELVFDRINPCGRVAAGPQDPSVARAAEALPVAKRTPFADRMDEWRALVYADV